MTPSPTQSDVQAALRAFLLAVLPQPGGDGNPISVVTAVANRVPEVAGTDFVLMSPLRFPRLRTNVDSDQDVRFTASIAGTAMTVSNVSFGTIEVGATVFGTNVAAGTTVVSGPGGGGVGTYVVSKSQTVSSEIMGAGQKEIDLNAEVVVQLDFHAGDVTVNGAVLAPRAADMAQAVSAALRDEFGTAFFAALSPPQNGVSPLYADDPRYMPFINEAQQYEWRWILECHLQVDQTILVPQQYADAITVQTLSVDATFPP